MNGPESLCGYCAHRTMEASDGCNQARNEVKVKWKERCGRFTVMFGHVT
jgi:hypothetical protein